MEKHKGHLQYVCLDHINFLMKRKNRGFPSVGQSVGWLVGWSVIIYYKGVKLQFHAPIGAPL